MKKFFKFKIEQINNKINENSNQTLKMKKSKRF